MVILAGETVSRREAGTLKEESQPLLSWLKMVKQFQQQ